MKYFRSEGKDGNIGTRQSNNDYISCMWIINPDGKHEIHACSSKKETVINKQNKEYLESIGCKFYSAKCEEITKEEYKMIKDFKKREHLIYSGKPVEKMFSQIAE